MSDEGQSFISLSDFQRLSGLSDRALLRLPKQDLLRCRVTEASEQTHDATQKTSTRLEVDFESVDNSTLIKTIATASRDESKKVERLIAEKFARLISEKIDDITDRAIELFLQKRSAQNSSSTPDSK